MTKDLGIAKTATVAEQRWLIKEELFAQDNLLDELYGAIDVLEVKLYPVMLQEENATGKELGTPYSWVEIADSIRNRNERILANLEKIRELINRISI